MPDSTNRSFDRLRSSAGAVLLALGLATSESALAEDGTIRVFASTFNKYAAALQPLTVSRTWSFTLWIPVPNPLLFGIPTPVPVPFTCAATATVTGVNFNIAPGSASVSGNVSGTVCGIAYQSALSTPLAITMDPSTRRLTVRPSGPLFVGATVNFMGFNISAPFGGVNLAPSLTGSFVLDAIHFDIETPMAPRSLILVTRNPQVSLQNGYVEVKADAFFR